MIGLLPQWPAYQLTTCSSGKSVRSSDALSVLQEMYGDMSPNYPEAELVARLKSRMPDAVVGTDGIIQRRLEKRFRAEPDTESPAQGSAFRSDPGQAVSPLPPNSQWLTKLQPA